MTYPCLDCRVSWKQLNMPFGSPEVPDVPESEKWRVCYAGAVNDIIKGFFTKSLKLEYMVAPLRKNASDLVTEFRQVVAAGMTTRSTLLLPARRNILCKRTWELHEELSSQIEGGSIPFRDVKDQIRSLLHASCTDEVITDATDETKDDEETREDSRKKSPPKKKWNADRLASLTTSWVDTPGKILREVSAFEMKVDRIFDFPFFGNRKPYPRGAEFSTEGHAEGLIKAINEVTSSIDRAENCIQESTSGIEVECSGLGSTTDSDCSLSKPPVEFPERLRTAVIELSTQNGHLKRIATGVPRAGLFNNPRMIYTHVYICCCISEALTLLCIHTGLAKFVSVVKKSVITMKKSLPSKTGKDKREWRDVINGEHGLANLQRSPLINDNSWFVSTSLRK